MAATVGVKPNEELNSIFRTLAERGKKAETYKKYNDFLTSSLLPQLSSKSNKREVDGEHVKIWAYGSAAEDLQSFDHCDAGDMDFMIFSTSDDLMIHEEMLEYSLENPLHVRIKGSDHPVLQSCLVEDKEYVATSALKKFHPVIFGSGAPAFVALLSFLSQMEEQGIFPFPFDAHLKNSKTSPAVNLNMSHYMNSATILKSDLLNALLNETAAEVSSIIHSLCAANGKEYTREHTELINDSLLLVTDYANSPMLNSLPHILFMFGPAFKDRCDKLAARFKGLGSRSLKGTVHNNDQQVVTPKKRNRKGRRRNGTNCSGATDKAHPRVTQQNCVINQRSPEDLEPTSSQSKMPRDLKKHSKKLSEELMCKGVIENDRVQGISGQNNESEDHNEDENQSKTKRESLAQTEELFPKDLSSNPDGKDDDEKRELESRCCRWEKVMSRVLSDKLETKINVTELVKNGIDFIPAFRSHGWPKVAREWIQRERKWPCPEIVDRVIQEGFHLVVKPPKNNGNPECDFRISFSHAEYLLSQEMNDIQRECYRCLKRYHRAYLSTQPKSLVSFHLKNIFLQTLEETGAEMWTESNRAECMMKLLGNLLKALTRKDLSHFFVRSYNLFGEDYIENVEILHSLAEKAEEIMRNPMRFAKQLNIKQEDSKECKEEKAAAKENVPNFPNIQNMSFAKPVAREQQKKTEEISSEGNYDVQRKKGSATVPLLPMKATQGSDPPELECRYHDLVPSGILTQFAQSAFSNLFETESTQLNMHGDIPLD